MVVTLGCKGAELHNSVLGWECALFKNSSTFVWQCILFQESTLGGLWNQFKKNAPIQASFYVVIMGKKGVCFGAFKWLWFFGFIKD